MSCSLFEVVDGKGKPTSGSLAALINKLERDRMVSYPIALSVWGSHTESLLKKTESQFVKIQILDRGGADTDSFSALSIKASGIYWADTVV